MRQTVNACLEVLKEKKNSLHLNSQSRLLRCVKSSPVDIVPAIERKRPVCMGCLNHRVDRISYFVVGLQTSTLNKHS